ncbi:MAG TPA: hypothetical protein PL017_06935 [Tenuifilaceae bacterium]|mgnify:CR=1 FL=1|nr:hypothetical protein [Tenuifilaceae bacterium]HPE17362.1 hypothetical protein [Tenuifilaceae bacterium]HPJ45816.1 hypothetical protein [Tenuifilaceae bacterium]HPQ33532.1 hypothetical protein [Tenuifilaceae bacterium]HRX66836.1 hypothetical protein [Tenuifilaceae bacterium]
MKLTNKIFSFSVIIVFLTFGTSSLVKAQLEQLQNICSLYFSPEFISDGQEYFAQLKPDQKVEFRTTFFGENTYRIVACTNLRKGDLVFTVYDTEKNLLFSNSDYEYSPYWDFRFGSTITCIIQVDVKSSKFIPGYVMLLIGYKP